MPYWRPTIPSQSEKQHNFMEAIAHSRAFAKKAKVPQEVGKGFAAADASKKKVSKHERMYKKAK